MIWNLAKLALVALVLLWIATIVLAVLVRGWMCT